VRVYLDSAPLIYLIEEVAPYAAALEERLAAPTTVQICSDLTRLECRVKPMREGQNELLSAFDSYFEEIIAEIVALSRPLIDHATQLRAHYGFRTPDALHLAAAIAAGCDLFLTNDHQLSRCTEITVEVL
jgi:predicted nucleic acid-binding protein